MLPAAEAEGDSVSISSAAMTKMGLHFWFGDFEGAIAQAEIVEDYLEGLLGTPNIPIFHLINALSRVQHAPNSRATRRASESA